MNKVVQKIVPYVYILKKINVSKIVPTICLENPLPRRLDLFVDIYPRYSIIFQIIFGTKNAIAVLKIMPHIYVWKKSPYVGK